MRWGSEVFIIIIGVLVCLAIILSAVLYYIIELNKPHEHIEKMGYIMNHTQDVDDRSYKVEIIEEPDNLHKINDIRFDLVMGGFGTINNDSLFVKDCIDTKTIIHQNLSISITYNNSNNDEYLNIGDYFIISTWHNGWDKFWDVNNYKIRLMSKDYNGIGSVKL